MTRNESRTESMREQNTREEEWTFEEPNALDIPESVQARFENEGMALRWIRVSLQGKDDISNVGKKMQAGTKLFYKGVRLILLFDDQIIMKVEDPKDLDPTFNLGKGSS